MSKCLAVSELSNCLSYPSRPRPFCSKTHAVSLLASPHIPQASSLPCCLGHREPCSCVCPSFSGPGRKIFVEADLQDSCHLWRPHCQWHLWDWECGQDRWPWALGSCPKMFGLPPTNRHSSSWSWKFGFWTHFYVLFMLATLLKITLASWGMREVMLCPLWEGNSKGMSWMVRDFSDRVWHASAWQSWGFIWAECFLGSGSRGIPGWERPQKPVGTT